MGQELRRKKQLVDAAIAVIGETGTLEVSVGKIAKRAGVSPALAFHYFGDKETLFLGAMRAVLGLYGASVRAGYARDDSPEGRLTAMTQASFGPENFQAGVISAWLNFYVMAYRSDEAKRLLSVYHARLRSNLIYAFRPLVGAEAPAAADRIASLIDGLYLRSAHDPDSTSGARATALVQSAIALELQKAQ